MHYQWHFWRRLRGGGIFYSITIALKEFRKLHECIPLGIDFWLNVKRIVHTVVIEGYSSCSFSLLRHSLRQD